MNRRILTLLFSLLLCCAVLTPAAAAEVDSDAVYCFAGSDFSGDETLSGICLTGLPDGSVGTVMLGARVLRSGDILTAEQLAQMTFHPLATEDDKDATVTYLPIFPDRVEAVATMTLSVLGKHDAAPV